MIVVFADTVLSKLVAVCVITQMAFINRAGNDDFFFLFGKDIRPPPSPFRIIF